MTDAALLFTDDLAPYRRYRSPDASWSALMEVANDPPAGYPALAAAVTAAGFGDIVARDTDRDATEELQAEADHDRVSVEQARYARTLSCCRTLPGLVGLLDQLHASVVDALGGEIELA